jgi:hypothetical protein
MSVVLEDDPLLPDASLARNARSKLSDPPPPVKTATRVKIVLEEDVGIPPTGLYISANGRPYLLMAGVEASVPPEVVSVLNDAVTSVPTIDPQTKRVVGYRSRLRFPYRRIDT